MNKEKVIIQKLATKHNLPLQKVEEIIYYQFKYVAKIMKEGGFATIRLPYFGAFSAKAERIAHLNEKTRRKNERLANSK
jgi:nucleoid DNA-binding protein